MCDTAFRAKLQVSRLNCAPVVLQVFCARLAVCVGRWRCVSDLVFSEFLLLQRTVGLSVRLGVKTVRLSWL